MYVYFQTGKNGYIELDATNKFPKELGPAYFY
jgi:hypothetical protein